MKKFLILFLLLPFVSNSQQDPYFVTDGFGALWNNPASFGAKNKFAINTLGRLQWVGLGSGPRLIMVNSEFGVDFSEFQFNNVAGKIGIGANFIAAEAGGFKEQIFQVPLNYQFKIDETYLSLGISTGFRRIDFTDIIWVSPQSPEDPLIPTQAQAVFQLDAGMYWYSDKFHVGISTTQFTSPRYDDINFQSARHYYLHGGYRFSLGEHFIFPQLQFKTDGTGLAFWNMNYFQFKEDIFSVGAGFGTNQILTGASFRFKFVKLAYNYGYDLSPLSNYTRGSHELRLSFAWK